jgi:hypothetical protein
MKSIHIKLKSSNVFYCCSILSFIKAKNGYNLILTFPLIMEEMQLEFTKL